MAFHHLLMGKSVSLRVLSVVGSLEWSTISKCGCDYWGENNSFNLHSYEYATPNDVAQGGFSLFACGILLLVHVDFTVDSNSAKPVSPSWVWAEMLPMNLLILMCLCQKAHWLLFPWVWVYLFVCLYIWTMLSSLFPHFPYLVVLLHPVLQQHWITPLQILSQTSVHFWLMWAFISFQQIELHCAGV